MNYIIITNDSGTAYNCLPHRDIYPMIDLENLGKKDRQKGNENYISDHTLDDLYRLASFFPADRLIARCNPIHNTIDREIENILKTGTKNIMFPMFQSPQEVETLVNIIDGRSRIFLLVETPAAVLRLPQIAAIAPKNSVFHLGLNDLRLALNLNHIFESLSSGFIRFALDKIKNLGFEYGFGGVGLNPNDAVPAKLILAYHKTFGSRWVILSRSFQSIARHDFSEAYRQITSYYNETTTINISHWSKIEHEVEKCLKKIRLMNPLED